MRLSRRAAVVLALLPLACGGRAAEGQAGAGSGSGTGSSSGSGTSSGSGAGSGSASGSGSGGSSGITPQGIVGRAFATTEAFEGQSSDRFDVQLQPFTPPASACEGATLTVGDCCYFAPTPPPPDPLPGSGGSPATETSAGSIALLDATSSASIATFGYASGIYASLPASYETPVWQPGDVLTVQAAGDPGGIGAFTVSAPALVPPVAQVPSSIAAGEDVVITWQPDPNAETMMVQLLDSDTGAVAACVVPDARGTARIDASLHAGFGSGDLCEVATSRSTDRYAQTPAGRVGLETIGWASYRASVP